MDESHYDENLLRQAVNAMRVRHAAATKAIDGEVLEADSYLFSNARSTNAWDNGVVICEPPSAEQLALIFDHADEFFGEYGYVAVSPWDVPEFNHPSVSLVGHPPFMARFVSHTPLMPPNFAVEEALNTEDVATFISTAKAGFESKHEIKLIDERTLNNPFRMFIGYENGEPVATGVAVAHGGVVLIEIVATVPSARRKGFGAAITDVATQIDADATAVLISSEKGANVYRELGFVLLNRWTIWQRN